MTAISLFVLFAGSLPALGQRETSRAKNSASSVDITAVETPAYAELLLRKTELESSLEALILDYTEEYPKVKEIRHALTLLKRDTDRLKAFSGTDVSKLTLALGKMMVRKVELETELWNLQKDYKDEHPDVKRAKKKLEIYDAAIKEIIG